MREFAILERAQTKRRHSERKRRIPRLARAKNLQIHKKANFRKFCFLFSEFRFPICKKLSLFCSPLPFFFSLSSQRKMARDGGAGASPLRPLESLRSKIWRGTVGRGLRHSCPRSESGKRKTAFVKIRQNQQTNKQKNQI